MNAIIDIKYIGVNDKDITLFEGQYDVENGMAYNSYLVLDDKIAIFDTTEAAHKEQWLGNIKETLNGRKPDYLVVLHMEPDHSACIKDFCDTYPEAKIVTSAMALTMMNNFFGCDFGAKTQIIKEGDTLELGNHSLHFISAPMVHWPEVMVCYDSTAKVLFSADGFGKFGTQDADEEWACEARRYYFGIVGKYGDNVQALLKKASTLDIEAIYPLHGPLLTENLGYYLDLYNTWSSYKPEKEGVAIMCGCVYGHTLEAANILANMLEAKGVKATVFDLTKDDIYEAVEDSFKYSKLVLCSSTYNMEAFPKVRDLIMRLVERTYRNRTVAFVENGSWAPNAYKKMREMMEPCKDITYITPQVTIKSALTDENKRQLAELAEKLK